MSSASSPWQSRKAGDGGKGQYAIVRSVGWKTNTIEIGDDFLDMKLPTLDVKIWVRDGLIEYEFFEKPMSANTVLNAKTAEVSETKIHMSRLILRLYIE